MKNTLFILILSFVFHKTEAQDMNPPRQVYFFLGVGFPIMKVRDQAHSPLKYQGWVPTLRIGHEEINQGFVSRIALSAGFGGGAPKSKPKATQSQSAFEISYFQFSYAYYSLLGGYDTEGWNRYLGGAFTFTFDLRNYNLPSNNLLGYQVNTSLNVGGFVRKKLSDDWRFNYEAITPVISYCVRPNYIGMAPATKGDFNFKDVIKSGKIVTVNKLFRFYNRFSFDQQINDHRQRRLSYTWDFHNNVVAKPLQSTSGGLGYESLFKM
jgi:hypothetical protein